MANNETKKFKFQVINIKLQTSKTGDEKLEAYENLIKRLKNRKVHSSVAENTHMIIYNYYKRETPISNVGYLYGTLGKGIYFEKETLVTLQLFIFDY